MNSSICCSLVVAAVWIAFGARTYFFPTCEILSIEAVAKTPSAFEGKVVTLEGIVKLGFEDGIVVPKGYHEMEDWSQMAVHLQFGRWLEKALNEIDLIDSACVKGTYRHSNSRGFGHMGIYYAQLENATFCRWPAIAAWILFLLMHVVPSALAVVVVVIASRRRNLGQS
jgi:hypothetical protein